MDRAEERAGLKGEPPVNVWEFPRWPRRRHPPRILIRLEPGMRAKLHEMAGALGLDYAKLCSGCLVARVFLSGFKWMLPLSCGCARASRRSPTPTPGCRRRLKAPGNRRHARHMTERATPP